MESIPFPESNLIMVPGNTCAKYELPVYRDEQQSISCWKPDQADLDRLNRGEPIWLLVAAGGQQPPVAVTTKHPWGREST